MQDGKYNTFSRVGEVISLRKISWLNEICIKKMWVIFKGVTNNYFKILVYSSNYVMKYFVKTENWCTISELLEKGQHTWLTHSRSSEYLVLLSDPSLLCTVGFLNCHVQKDGDYFMTYWKKKKESRWLH